MLLSVTQLPQTCPTGSVVSGQMVLNTVPQEVTLADWSSSVQEQLVEGRNLDVRDGITFYKAEFVEHPTNIFTDVILASDKPFDTHTFRNSNGKLCRVYPLFCRKRIGNGGKSRTYLCIWRINNFFTEQCIVSGQPYSDVIISKEEFVGRLIKKFAFQPIADQLLDYRFGLIQEAPTLLFDDMELVAYASMGDASNGVYSAAFTRDMLPYEVQAFVHTVQTSDQIPHLYGACGPVFSPVKASCELNCARWPQDGLYRLMEQGRVVTTASDVYNSDAHIHGPMSKFLSLLYGGETYDDFRYVVDLTGLMHPIDTYVSPTSIRGLGLKYSMARDGNVSCLTDYLLEAIGMYGESIDEGDQGALDIHKTWTEDLFIYSNATGKLLLVVPLIWFMLACTPDVVNMTNVYAIGGC